MSQHIELKDYLTQALWLYHNKYKGITTHEILRSLEIIRHDLTEEFVKQHGKDLAGNLYDRTKTITKPARKRDDQL